jgi:hypothetical protein
MSTQEDLGEPLAGAAQKEPPLVERAYEQRAEMRVRHAELKSVSERLDLVAPASRARKWEIRSQVGFGAFFGGLVGIVPFLAVEPPLLAAVGYAVVLVAVLLLTLIFGDAAEDVAAERADSVLAIKEHIDNTMLRTTVARLQPPAPTRRVAGPPISAPRPPEPPSELIGGDPQSGPHLRDED